MRGITKSFSGVSVLDAVDFDLAPGEVHVLAGENGAGKSTLMKVLCGVYTDFHGSVRVHGTPLHFRSAADAARNGISMIHQEMSLIPAMSVVDNIFLGRERTRGGPWMDHGRQEREAGVLLADLGLELDLRAPVETYPVSVRQMIEIAKALAFRADILVMDEPTSAINRQEAVHLFDIVERLKQAGCGIVYISHKLDEIYLVADRITVLRDGRRVGTARRDDLAPPGLVTWMVGRELDEQFPARPLVGSAATPRMEAVGVSLPDRAGRGRAVVDSVSFRVAPGEILGVAGLQGAGNHELLRGLFDASPSPLAGSVRLDGQPFRPRSPRASIARGVALLTGDRKADGLVPAMGVTPNLTLASIPRFSPGAWMRSGRERCAAEAVRLAMNVRLRSLDQPVSELSGGNQQKVVLGKWLETGPRVLLLDEPTRGVDVGAKQEIYGLLNRWSREGIAMLLITSEMSELLAMSDSIMVMHRGRVTARLAGPDMTQENVLRAAMGDGGGTMQREVTAA